MKDFIDELQDLRYLDWTNKKRSVGTPGCFLKAYEEKNGIRFYYKLSNYDSYRGIFEHECVNELIVSRLLDVLEDKKVNNFIGSRSLEYNLNLIPKGKKLFSGKLKTEHETVLLGDLDKVLSEIHLKKIWEMLWERWKRYEEICNSYDHIPVFQNVSLLRVMLSRGEILLFICGEYVLQRYLTA